MKPDCYLSFRVEPPLSISNPPHNISYTHSQIHTLVFYTVEDLHSLGLQENSRCKVCEHIGHYTRGRLCGHGADGQVTLSD